MISPTPLSTLPTENHMCPQNGNVLMYCQFPKVPHLKQLKKSLTDLTYSCHIKPCMEHVVHMCLQGCITDQIDTSQLEAKGAEVMYKCFSVTVKLHTTVGIVLIDHAKSFVHLDHNLISKNQKIGKFLKSSLCGYHHCYETHIKGLRQDRQSVNSVIQEEGYLKGLMSAILLFQVDK